MKLRFLLLLALTTAMYGQGVRFDNYNVTSAKNVPVGAQAAVMTLPFSTVTVCPFDNNLSAACTSGSTNIYSDAALTQLIAQPFQSDSQGRFGFWVAPGVYKYSVTTASGTQAGNFALSLNVGPGCFTTSACLPVGGTFQCVTYASLNACLDAAKAYVGSAEDGTGRAAKIIIPDGTFALSSPPYALASGMTIEGVTPRFSALSNYQWGPQAQPNGGTWIDCGGQTCFTATAGGANGVSNINFHSVGFKNWGAAIAVFGATNAGGLTFGSFTDIYAIGSSTIGASDQGFVFHQTQLLAMSNVNIINVNTCLNWINDQGSTLPIDGGNSVLSAYYCYPYPKSVAYGNSAEPIYNLSGPNFLTFIRPQYFMAQTGSGGDNTSDGILITNNAAGGNTSTHITIIAADLEGAVKNSVHLVGVTGNSIDIAVANQETNAVDIAPSSTNNSISCQVAGCPMYLEPGVFPTSNSFFGQMDFRSGSVIGNGTYWSSANNTFDSKADRATFVQLKDIGITLPAYICTDIYSVFVVGCPGQVHPINFTDSIGGVYTANKIITTQTTAVNETVPVGGNITTTNGVACVTHFKLQNAPTATTVFTILQDTFHTLGTATFAAGSFDAVISIPAADLIVAGDVIQVVAPASPDATAAGLYGSICATY